jgi:hypothetical protein
MDSTQVNGTNGHHPKQWTDKELTVLSAMVRDGVDDPGKLVSEVNKEAANPRTLAAVHHKLLKMDKAGDLKVPKELIRKMGTSIRNTYPKPNPRRLNLKQLANKWATCSATAKIANRSKAWITLSHRDKKVGRRDGKDGIYEYNLLDIAKLLPGPDQRKMLGRLSSKSKKRDKDTTLVLDLGDIENFKSVEVREHPPAPDLVSAIKWVLDGHFVMRRFTAEQALEEIQKLVTEESA